MIDELKTIYVIPDIHGHLEVLEAMLSKAGFGDKGDWRTGTNLLVQLGDLVDRGERSRECVERMMELQAASSQHIHVLKGNHEDMILNSWEDSMARRSWLLNGGTRTLESYSDGFETLLEPGGKHFEWFQTLPVSFEFKQVLFCHAGISKKRGGVLDQDGLIWDRPPLEKAGFRMVVCAHTPTASGHIEFENGVYRCDLGIGHGTEKGLEILKLSVSDREIVPQIVTIW